MKKPKSFTEAVKMHLLKHGSITVKQAINLYGSHKLSSRINELRHELRHELRWIIETKKEFVKTRYGYTAEVAKYVLKSVPKTKN